MSDMEHLRDVVVAKADMEFVRRLARERNLSDDDAFRFVVACGVRMLRHNRRDGRRP